MKHKSLVATSLLALGLITALRAQDIKLNLPGQATAAAPATPAAPPAATPAAPAQTFTEAQLLEEYGWFIGKRIGLTDLNFTPAQIDLVLRGITLASQDKPSPNEIEKIG